MRCRRALVKYWDGITTSLTGARTCSGEAQEPRIAFSFEFIARDEAPTPEERPLYEVERLPTFEQRLLAVARGVLQYAKFEPALIRFADLMEQTVDRIRLELKSQFAEGP